MPSTGNTKGGKAKGLTADEAKAMRAEAERFATAEVARHARRLHCADCKRECTAGTDGGPATTDVDGITRCWKCARVADEKRGQLNRAAPALLAACKAALRKVSGTNIMGEQVEPRLVAKLRAAIAKAEGK
jgi:hypothetical protein